MSVTGAGATRSVLVRGSYAVAPLLLGRAAGNAPVPPAPFPTQMEKLDLLVAPAENWHLSLLTTSYQRIIIDCGHQLKPGVIRLLRSAATIIVPLPVTADAQEALDRIVASLDAAKARSAPLLPVFTKADRRRASHREAVALRTDWPLIPYSGAVGATSGTGAALGKIAPRSPAARAFGSLWSGIERRIARLQNRGPG